MGRKNRKQREEAESSADKKPKARELKFAVQGEKGSYATFTTVRDALIHHLRQTTPDGGNDVGDSIKNNSLLDLNQLAPNRVMATNPDDKIREFEQGSLDMLYQQQLKSHLYRSTRYETVLRSAYSTIITKYCTKKMKAKIEEHPDFESRIEDNPVEAIKTIKLLMHENAQGSYIMASYLDAMVKFSNAKQHDNEELGDYVKRVKQLRDNFKSQVGVKVVHETVEKLPQYIAANDAQKKHLLDTSFGLLEGYILLNGCDKKKYGSLVRGLESQFSLGNDQYPKSLKDSNEILSRARFDEKYYEKTTSKSKSDKEKKKKPKEEGSKKKEKEDGTSTESSFAQSEIVCYCCGKSGHISPECKLKDKIPREKWHVNKALQTHQQEVSDESDDEEDEEEHTQGWCGLQLDGPPEQKDGPELVANQCGSSKFDHLKNTFILDTGSTINATVMNPNMIYDVRRSKHPTIMATNAGNKKMELEGNIAGFGVAKFDPDQMANILGFSHVRDKYRVTYDSDVEDAFNVHTDKGVTKFKRVGRLYCFTPDFPFWEGNAKKNAKNEAMLTPATEEP